jgi:molybdopterin molybdotransferase
MNHASLAVRRKLLVAVLANGDELVEPGRALGPGQIVSSIPAGVKAAIEAWGGEAIMTPIARDDRESLAASIASVPTADVLLTIGGASVGEHDLVRGVLEGRGAKFQVLKAAMRPGKPVMFGFLGEQRVLSLPGNPISALICARVFLRPLLNALLGLSPSEDTRLAPLAVALGANGDREHYMRATLSEEGVRPIPEQDSSFVNAFAQADCLLVRPAKAPSSPKGALAPIIPLDF